MEEQGEKNFTALVSALSNAVKALGRGFDVTADTRLLYCKGPTTTAPLIKMSDTTCDLEVPGYHGLVVPDVPADVDVLDEVSGGKRETAIVWSFQEMAEYFNRKSGLSETVPLGSFNSMFNFTGSWQVHAAATKALAMDGYCISLFKVELTSSALEIRDDIKRAIPHGWDPSALASFIENFGTHIVTSVTIGGRDEVFLKQHHSSLLPASDIAKYVKDIGDRRFSNVLNVNSSHPQPPSAPLITGTEDVTVIFRRRGGNDLVQDHADWAKTIPSAPDVINMTFVPIVSLLESLPGMKNLARAVDLYLEYKPPIEELQYFLDFQLQRVWAPAHATIHGNQRKDPVSPFVQFSLMGPKLYISLEQISVGRKPVTGLRLCLEGTKQNRLAIHVQHLASLPKIFQTHWGPHIAIGQPKWKGPEEQDSRWFEPIKWKNFAHVSTAPIEHTETTIGDFSGVYIVTGAQLGVWDFGAKSVLYLKLMFSKVPGCTIRRSVWDHNPSGTQNLPKSDDASPSSSNENMNPSGKLAKIIDITELSKGPQDTPGHWVITGAKLGVEKGKIILRVKYSILNY